MSQESGPNLPANPEYPIDQLADWELSDYRKLLEQALADETIGTAPIARALRAKLDEVLAEQRDRKANRSRPVVPPGSPVPARAEAIAEQVAGMSGDELIAARRLMAASLGLTRRGSPILRPSEAYLAAVDAELARRYITVARPEVPETP